MNLYSPEPAEAMLANLNILFDGSYSPFESLLSMQAKVQLHQLHRSLTLDGLEIAYHPVDHGDLMRVGDPAPGTFAYRFTASDGATVCLITDHEARNTKLNRDLVAWAKGVDLLIHDGQYLEDEYLRHVGWGHSTARTALDNAIKIGAGLTLLTHHDPSRNDRDLQALHRQLTTHKKYRRLTFEFAREEIVYEAAKVKTLPKAG
jgi:ribonuclease BN (tRNA processing enzyme)